jgi:hypothetical protein
MKTVPSFLLSLILLAPAAAGQTLERQDESLRPATEAAQRALATFARLASEENYRALGFDSREQVRSGKLGIPARGFMIRLDELREYGGGDPTRLLHSADRVTFPVEVEGRTRSSITVALREGSWLAESFGASSYARLFTEARARLAEREGRPAAEILEVQVPALNVRFVGARRNGALVFAPVVDDARFGFKRGEPIPAEEALTKLVPAAKEHNGLPT